MIQLHTIPEYHNELNTFCNDYNGMTPHDELKYHIESNLEFIDNENEALKQLIASEPQ